MRWGYQMRKNTMSDALRNREMSGLDLTIVINPKEEEEENKALGLAPDAGIIGSDPGAQDIIQVVDGDSVKGSMNAAAPNDKKDVGEEDSLHSDESQDKLLIAQELAKAGLGMRKKTKGD